MLLPVEIWWDIYDHIRRQVFQDVQTELRQLVVLADPDPDLRYSRLGRCEKSWHRHTTLVDLHRCNWGLWRDGQCRHYTGSNHGYWVGNSYLIYKNMFYFYFGVVDRQVREVEDVLFYNANP